MNFEEALADLIDSHLAREGYDGIMSALELKLMALKEEVHHALEDEVD